MKAVQMIGAGQPLELHEIPVPAIGERDILVRVPFRCALSGRPLAGATAANDTGP